MAVGLVLESAAKKICTYLGYQRLASCPWNQRETLHVCPRENFGGSHYANECTHSSARLSSHTFAFLAKFALLLSYTYK